MRAPVDTVTDQEGAHDIEGRVTALEERLAAVEALLESGPEPRLEFGAAVEAFRGRVRARRRSE